MASFPPGFSFAYKRLFGKPKIDKRERRSKESSNIAINKKSSGAFQWFFNALAKIQECFKRKSLKTQ